MYRIDKKSWFQKHESRFEFKRHIIVKSEKMVCVCYIRNKLVNFLYAALKIQDFNQSYLNLIQYQNKILLFMYVFPICAKLNVLKHTHVFIYNPVYPYIRENVVGISQPQRLDLGKQTYISDSWHRHEVMQEWPKIYFA